jgi:predicted nucleotidyltransferase
MALKKYAFLNALRAIPVIEKIILYGSRARGDNRERSDIDLAIVCPQATEKDWQKIVEIIEEADTLLVIDCVRFDTLAETSPLKESILRDGVVIYEKGRS